MTLDELFARVCSESSNMQGHCRTLRDLAAQCDEVIEFGTGDLVSTTALLAGQPRRFTTYDVESKPDAERLAEVCGRTEFYFSQLGSLDVPPVACDMLFIDTIHTGRHLYAELLRHAAGVRRWIVLHDTEAFALWDDCLQEPGLWPAIWRWLRDNHDWRIASVSRECFGLTILERWR